MTDNVQLMHYINKHKNKLRNRHFMGIFSSDELPIVNSHNACLIINYSPSNKPTEGHWVAILDLNTPNKSAYYFDSYGFDADADDSVLHDTTHFRDFLIKNSATGHYDYNKIDFQGYSDPNNDVCGEFSAVAILYGRPDPKAPIWNKLMKAQSTKERDIIIRQFVGIIPVKNK